MVARSSNGLERGNTSNKSLKHNFFGGKWENRAIGFKGYNVFLDKGRFSEWFVRDTIWLIASCFFIFVLFFCYSYERYKGSFKHTAWHFFSVVPLGGLETKNSIRNHVISFSLAFIDVYCNVTFSNLAISKEIWSWEEQLTKKKSPNSHSFKCVCPAKKNERLV